VEVAHANDLEFAGQIAAGDEAAATELFRRFSGEMFGYSRKMIGDPILSEDVLQEAMLAQHRKVRWAGQFARLGLRNLATQDRRCAAQAWA